MDHTLANGASAENAALTYYTELETQCISQAFYLYMSTICYQAHIKLKYLLINVHHQLFCSSIAPNN